MNSTSNNQRQFKKSLLAIVIAATIQSAFAGAVRNDIDYQYFRDFAENKGDFIVGAMNVPVFDKKGNKLGDMLPNIPMMDFSSAERTSGVAVAIAKQYVVSVAHNGGYSNVQFGGEGNNPDAHHFNYQLVDRNDYTSTGRPNSADYHVPRLAKLITEIVPSNTVDLGDSFDGNTYLNKERFPYFIRVGAGLQTTRHNNPPPAHLSWNDGSTDQELATGYVYLTGGTPMRIYSAPDYTINARTYVFRDEGYGPMSIYAMSGDSGSSLWAWDTTVAGDNKWVHIGTLEGNTGYDGTRNFWNMTRDYWHGARFAEDIAANLTTRGADLIWTPTGTSSKLASGDNQFNTTVDLADMSLTNPTGARPANPALNHGKSVILNGFGSLTLSDNINQGAGSLTFNGDYTVKGATNSTTWLGAGVDVAKGATVNWQVHNPNGDRLSKIGNGTLVVNGIGVNGGDISVGDGLVVLNQTKDASGNIQAFNQLGIVSGRPTVQLNSSDQVNPNNIYFGFRGGRLDVNGNDLTFNRIQNVDAGARIVNHNDSQASNITLSGILDKTTSELTVGDRVLANQDLYLWQKTRDSADYFLPKTNHRPYYQTNQQSNDDWEYLGSDLAAASAIALDRINAARSYDTFNGYLGETDTTKTNGELNVRYAPNRADKLLMISGGANLNGNLTADNGKLLLSGRPIERAYDVNNKKDVIVDSEWHNRTFNATNMIATGNGKLEIGRNVTAVNANFSASDNATLGLGFVDDMTPVCIRSDYTGAMLRCDTQTLSAEVDASVPTTAIHGNIKLSDTSHLYIGKAHLTGKINATDSASMHMNNNSHWDMTADSTIGSLTMTDGSVINLGGKDDAYQSLTIGGDLSGHGLFRFATDVANTQGDKVLVKGSASGSHSLQVTDTGADHFGIRRLGLLTVNGSDSSAMTLSNNLGENHVDIGAYRYTLIKDGNTYYLHNPMIEKALRDAKKGNTIVADLPSDTTGDLVNESLPELHFSHSTAVTSNELPELHLDHGDNLTNADQPILTMGHGGDLINDALPSLDIAHGDNLANDDLPTLNIDTDSGLTNDALPSLDLAHGGNLTNGSLPVLNMAYGDNLTNADQPILTMGHGGDLINDALPSLDIAHGDNLANDDLPTLNIDTDSGLTNDALPSLDLAHGDNLTNDDLPVFEMPGEPVVVKDNGTGAIADTLPTLDITHGNVDNGESLVNNDNPTLSIAHGGNLTNDDKPSLNLSHGDVDSGESLVNQDKPVLKIPAKPTVVSDNGSGVINDDKHVLEIANGNSNTGKAITTAALPTFNQAELISKYANTALSDLHANANAVLNAAANIDERLYDEPTETLKVWMHGEVRKGNFSSKNYRNYGQDTTLLEIGLEKSLADHDTQIGAILSNSRSDNNYADRATGKQNYTQAALYARHQINKDITVLADVARGKSRNSMRIDDRVDFDRDVTSVGIHTAKYINLGNFTDNELLGKVNVQPSVGARYHRLTAANYTIDGAQVSTPNVGLLTLHAGAKFNTNIVHSDYIIRPEFGTYYVAANRNTKISVNDIPLDITFSNHWRNEVGVSSSRNGLVVSAAVGVLSNDQSNSQRYANLKLSYDF